MEPRLNAFIEYASRKTCVLLKKIFFKKLEKEVDKPLFKWYNKNAPRGRDRGKCMIQLVTSNRGSKGREAVGPPFLLAVVVKPHDVTILIHRHEDERVGIHIVVEVVVAIVVIVEHGSVLVVQKPGADLQGVVDDVLLVVVLHGLFPPFHFLDIL